MALYNCLGNINIEKTVDSDITVKATLRQTKELQDIDEKKSNLIIQPKEMNGILLIEPLTGDGFENYWEWIGENLNMNGICIDFEIQVPESIKEIRVYNEIGNINLDNVEAKIDSYVNIGKISGTDIIPLDESSFITNMSNKKSEESVNIEISSLDYSNKITLGTEMGNIVLSIQDSSEYLYQPDAEFYVEDLEHEDAREFCLIETKAIKKKNGKTIIISNVEDPPISNVRIEN